MVRENDRKYLIVLVVMAILASIVRFGHIYPDSIFYLIYVDYFDGVATVQSVTSPFALRPVLPFIVSLLNGLIDSVLVFSLLNMMFVCLIGIGLYEYIKTYQISNKAAFIVAAVCTVSYPVIYFGAMPLVDALAVLVMLIIVMGQRKGKGDLFAMTMFLFGAIVKEVVLFIGIYYILKEGIRKIWVLIPAATLHLYLRFLIFNELANTLIFNLNIFDRMGQVIGMFGMTFAILFVVMVVKRGKCSCWKTVKKDSLYGIIALVPLVFLGLFFAYFDGRFLWPLYIPLAPMVACLISNGD